MSTNTLLLLIALLAIACALTVEAVNDRDMPAERIQEAVEP
jgi:hypothetical protein